MKADKWKATALLVALILLSLLKDELTPDYRNTQSALFLSPELLQGSRLATLVTHGLFWFKALLYTVCFVLLPTGIVHFAFRQQALTRFTLYLHLGAAMLLYLSVFANLASLDHILVSKVNRYLHSPIITLFLWAAFTLTNKKTSP